MRRPSPRDLVPTVNACSRLRSKALRGFGHRLVAARLADLERHFELRSNDTFALLDGNRVTFLISKHVRLAGLQHAIDPVDQTRRNCADGLLVVMPLVHHKTPVHGGKIWIDLACDVRSDVQRPLDAIATALCQPLTGLLYATGRTSGRKHTAESTYVILIAEAPCVAEHPDEQGMLICTEF